MKLPIVVPLLLSLVSARSVVDPEDSSAVFRGPKYLPPLPEDPPELLESSSGNAPACFINVNGDLVEPQPLIIRPGTEEWVFPADRRGIIELEAAEKIEVFCTSGFENRRNATNAILSCVSGKTFADDLGARNDFGFYKCVRYPFHDAIRTNKTCFNNASVLDLGFKVQSRFLSVFEICFDERLERTHYVTHFFAPEHVNHQSGFPRPGWLFNGYFGGKNVDSLYTRVNQRATIASILGSDAKAGEYIHPTNDFFLARGHLAAKSDFIFGSHHLPTFWMMNIAPQWQVFNGGNWLEIEIGIKNFVADRNIVVDAYTGTFGVTTLKDVAGQEQEIYLAFDGNRNGLIPVPKVYYKILVDRETLDGIVLVGVNNPYVTLDEIRRDYSFCSEDVGDRVSWIKWDRRNISKGYSYACDVNDFFRVVPHLPFVTVKGLLV